jgi:hypothetical protein
MNVRRIAGAAVVAVASMTLTVQAQNFGAAKTKVTLQRKLPALIHVPESSIRVKASMHGDTTNLAQDLQSQLETELLKDDAKLREDDTNPETTVTCEITNVGAPKRIVTQVPNMMAGKTGPKTVPNVRVTASLTVSFQAKTRDGHMLGSDNVEVNYDQEFDASGNNVSHGVMGGLSNSWHKLKGSSGNDSSEDKAPTDAELRTLLLDSAVHRIASNIVNTNESIDVFLAKDKGAIDEGDKSAEAGLWERALETYETAQPLSKKEDDAYRLYDIGVANEALGYAAEDPKAAMKFLDEAAINYGKAIDAKPSEKYFLDPQKRIQTALAHYRKLEEAKNAPPPPPAAPPPAPTPAPTVVATAPPATNPPASTPPKSTPSARHTPATTAKGPTHPSSSGSTALTDTQVISMVKSGIADDSVEQMVKNAKAVDFDLSSAGQRKLTAAGVSPSVLSAMKVRAAQELANQK